MLQGAVDRLAEIGGCSGAALCSGSPMTVYFYAESGVYFTKVGFHLRVQVEIQFHVRRETDHHEEVALIYPLEKEKAMARQRKPGLQVVVGTPWPEGIEVHVESPAPATDDPKSRVALRLALSAGISVGVFAAYGMFRGDGALLDRILKLVEYVVIFLCGWVGGRPKGP